MVLRVNDEQGEWVGGAGVGSVDGAEKPPVDGHFRVGSNTKTFTAAVVLGLVAEGRMELDAAVAGYLPAFGLDEQITDAQRRLVDLVFGGQPGAAQQAE